jgi:hypothetical protein
MRWRASGARAKPHFLGLLVDVFPADRLGSGGRRRLEHEHRPDGARRAHLVVAVVQLAPLQAEAAAADAFVELGPRAREQLDLLVDLCPHPLADVAPVARRRRATVGQQRKLLLDLPQRQAEPLGDEDEAHAANVGAQEATLVSLRPQRVDQPLVLVEANGGHRDARARRQRPDRNDIVLGDRWQKPSPGPRK